MSNNKEPSIILSKKTVLHGQRHNVLVIGGAGSGKTRNYVLPNLLQCNGSYVVVDLGGVLRKATEKIFKEKGYLIKTLNITPMSLADAEQMDLSMISFQPTIIYVIPCFNRSVNDAVIPLFIDKVLANTHENGIPIHLFLDEFINLGQIPYFYCLLAAKKISYSVIIQNITQLEMLYRETWLAIVGSCDTIVYLGSFDEKTLGLITRWLGKETVNINGVDYHRQVMSSEEIRYMPPQKCLVMTRGQSPIMDEKYDPKEHPNYVPHNEPEPTNDALT